MRKINGALTVVVMDGVGISDHEQGNAVRLAHTPVLDRLMQTSPMTPLRAHGRAVGMPSDADMGNSEVGHNAIGSGQIIDQGASLVNQAIATGALFRGETWRQVMASASEHNGTLHFVGLLSDGNVHSHIDHVLALLEAAASQGQARARVHVLLDGRDVGERSAQIYLEQLESQLEAHRRSGHDYRIASGGGRMQLTMDRYQADWDMVARGWAHHVHGEGRQFPDAMTALRTLRDENPGVIDQNLPGFVIADSGSPIGAIHDGDGVVFFNFRGDRAIELSQAFDSGTDFDAFDRGRVPQVYYCGMMQYDGDLMLPRNYLVGPPTIADTLTQCLVSAGVRQFAISETQKFGHVTYFWNGNRSGKMDPEREIFAEVPSDQVPFEQRPWMKAAEITDLLIAELESGANKFLRVNYANGDMVGHSGDLNATMVAMSCLDLVLGRLLSSVARTGGVALVTADHGNAEQMVEYAADGSIRRDDQGNAVVRTAHSLNPVPFILFDPLRQVERPLRAGPDLGLTNIAATVTHLLGLKSPSSWRPSLLS